MLRELLASDNLPPAQGPSRPTPAHRVTVKKGIGGGVITMVECSACGQQNELGRVFCAGCGTKLNLDMVVSLDRERRRGRRKSRGVSSFVIVLLLAVAACVGLALWPQQASPVRCGQSRDALRLKKQFGLVRSLQPGRKIAIQENNIDK